MAATSELAIDTRGAPADHQQHLISERAFAAVGAFLLATVGSIGGWGCTRLPAGLPTPPTVRGLDGAGHVVTWSPSRGRVSVLVVLKSADCSGCVSWYVEGVKRLVATRAADVDACFVFIGPETGNYVLNNGAGGVRILFDRKGEVVKELRLPGLPYAFVWTRDRQLARAQWISTLGGEPDAVAADLERCFALGG